MNEPDTTVSLTYTPGPLKVWGTQRDTNIGGFTVIGRDSEQGGCTAYVHSPGDAALYVAAPDMLAALKNLEVYADVQLRWHRGAQDDHVWESILTAIDKAEGRIPRAAAKSYSLKERKK